MSIRKIINLVENAMPSVEDIEGEIAPATPMTTTSKEFNPPQLIDRAGQIRPMSHDTLDRVVADGWVALTYSDRGWRVTVKLDGHKVTRAALTKAIEVLEASGAGDLRIEDLTTRIPQNFSGWTRDGGLAILKTLLRKIKAIRAIGGDPKPGRVAYGGVPGAFDLPEASLRETYLLELMEASDEVDEEEPEAETVEEGLVGDALGRMIATGMADKDIISMLERAQEARQIAKSSRVKPQKSKVAGWGDADFYTKKEHTLVMKVFKNFQRLHKSGRKNEAIMADFDKYAKRAGYHGPRPVLAPDGINSHFNEALDEGLSMDYRSLFLRAYDRQPKNEVGFNRAADEARLTAAQRQEMKAEVLSPVNESADPVKASDCSVGAATSVGKLIFDIRVTCGDKHADIRVKAATAEEAKKKVLTQDRLDMAKWKTTAKVSEMFGMSNKEKLNKFAEQVRRSLQGSSIDFDGLKLQYRGFSDEHMRKGFTTTGEVKWDGGPVVNMTATAPGVAPKYAQFNEKNLSGLLAWLDQASKWQESQHLRESDEDLQEAENLREIFGMFGDGDAKPGTWKRWSGGSCPVGEDEIVHYKTRGGRKSACPAGQLNWANDGDNPADDIVAYAL